MQPRSSFPAQTSGVTCAVAALAAIASRHGFAGYASASAARAAEVQSRLHRIASRTGIPWPRMLGTAPWALSRLASAATGKPYAVFGWCAGTANGPDSRAPYPPRMPGLPRRLFGRSSGGDALLAAIDADEDCLIYVGGSSRRRGLDRWIARHVVAVLGRESDRSMVRIFEPSSGRTHSVEIGHLMEPSGRSRPEFGNWCFPILVVAPRR